MDYKIRRQHFMGFSKIIIDKIQAELLKADIPNDRDIVSCLTLDLFMKVAHHLFDGEPDKALENLGSFIQVIKQEEIK